MGLKGKPWRGLVGAEGIIDGTILITHRKLSADFDLIILRKVLRKPCGETIGIAKVTALGLVLGAVQVAEEIPYQNVNSVACT